MTQDKQSETLPRISVVIPCHNRGNYLEEAVRSALDQQGPFELVEIVIVDDHSDEPATQEILGRLGEHDLIRVLENPGRRGPAAARNVGIHAACADWIAFLDSDDIWLEGALASWAEIVAAHGECQWLGADMDKWYEDGRRESRGGRLTGARSGPVLRQAGGNGCVHLPQPVIESIDANLTWTSTTMARTELLRRLGGYNETLIKSEDAHLWIRLARATDLWFVPRVLALYRQHDENITAGSDPLDDWSVRAYKALLGEEDFRSFRRLLRTRIARLYRRQGRHYRQQRQFPKAVAAFARSLRFAPAEKKNWRGLIGSALRRV